MRRLIATIISMIIAASILFICLMAGAFGALSPSVSAAGNNTLQGVVLDSASNPVGGIEVSLFKRNAAQTWEFLYATLTDAHTGAFAFSALADGDYTLGYSHPQGEWVQQFHLARATREEADPIALTGGVTEQITAVIQRAASIEGVVTSDAQPFAPLSSIPVTLWRQTGDSWIQTDRGDATNDDGFYRIAGLSSGVYRLHFGYSGGGDFFDIWYPNAAAIEDSEDISLGAGEQRTVTEVRLPRKSTIAGSLALPSEMAGDGVHICAVAVGSPTNETTGAPIHCASSDLTDGDGLFEIPNLRAGEYLLYVKDGAFPQRVFDRWYPVSPKSAPVQLLALAAGATLQVEPIPLVAADSVFGTLHSAQGEPANGAPANGVQVRLYESTNGGLRWDYTAWTNEAGQFDLQLRRPSTWTVGYFDPSGTHAPLYFPYIETIADADVTAIPTQTHSLNAGTVLQVGRTLQGRVVDANGIGLPGVEVHTFFPAESDMGNEQGRMMPEWLRVVTTNAAGEYAFNGLGVEPVLLYFRDAAGFLQPKWYGAGGTAVNAIDGAAPVSVAAGGTTLASLALAESTSTPAAEGGDWQIRNQATGMGIDGARITLYWLPGWRAQVESSDDEPFTCPTYTAAGSALLSPLSPNAVIAFAGAGILQPDVNPQLGNAEGGFGWRLPPGCWQVRAEATGYYSATSSVWGVSVGQIEMPNFSLALARIGGEPTPTSTPSATPTPLPTTVPTVPATNTPTPSATSVPATGVFTPVPTATPSSTGSVSPSATATTLSHSTPVGSHTPTFTSTPTDTPTNTPTHTPTFTPTPTATETPVVTGEPIAEASSTPLPLMLHGVIYADLNRNGRQDEGEAGIAGVHLQIVEDARIGALGSGEWQSEAITDNAGRFTFVGVPAGNYGLRVTPPLGMTLITPAILPLVVSGRDGVMANLHVGVAMEPSPVLLPLIGK